MPCMGCLLQGVMHGVFYYNFTIPLHTGLDEFYILRVRYK